MIYTITLNPAIDYVLNFNNFKLNQINRSTKNDIYAAGKGIHVSKLLTNIGAKNISIYISSKINGNWFDEDCHKQGLKTVPIYGEGIIRTNLKLIDQKSQTECNTDSLIITQTAKNNLKEFINLNVTKDDWVILSGSSPKGFEVSDFLSLCSIITKKTRKFVVDNSNPEIIIRSSKYKPIFIKPNREEFKSLQKYIEINFSLTNPLDIYNKILSLGIKNIVISLGSEGAKLINKEVNETIAIKNKLTIKNLAGSGDSMVAGIVAKLNSGENILDALMFGIICGSATACSERIASQEKINQTKKEIW